MGYLRGDQLGGHIAIYLIQPWRTSSFLPHPSWLLRINIRRVEITILIVTGKGKNAK